MFSKKLLNIEQKSLEQWNLKLKAAAKQLWWWFARKQVRSWKNVSQFGNNSKVYKIRDLISAKFTDVIPNKVCIWKLNSILWKSSKRQIETFVKKFSGKHYAYFVLLSEFEGLPKQPFNSRKFSKNIHWRLFSFN